MFSQPRSFQRIAPQVVGSLGNAQLLRDLSLESVRNSCDILEIRLDHLAAEGETIAPSLWSRWLDMPLLFTARCPSEGGLVPSSTLEQRLAWLKIALPDASAIDIEVVNLEAAREFLPKIFAAKIPLIASYHDFSRTPSHEVLEQKLTTAHQFGATVFKAAAKILELDDFSSLANFQHKPAILPKALMGMGELGPVSRLLLAQLGSVLNYGYLGEVATAPGQWHARDLKQAISRLPILS